MVAKRDWIDKDFYAVLGVSKDADHATIKKAYRKIARDNHPDQHPDDAAAEKRFKEAGEAWAVLSDEESRREYDEVRRLAASGAFNGHGAHAGGFPGGGGGDFSDIFRVIFEQQGAGGDMPFGFTQTRRRPRRGRDLMGQVSLSFDDALVGVTTTLRLAGSREVQVRIPAGITDGARIKIAGRGEPGADGGPPGDVVVQVHVGEHEVYGRAGRDVTLEVPITFAEAALGTKLEVPLPLGGTKRIRIPKGTASGATFRIRGAGAPGGKKKDGDLLVTVQVQVPTELSREQRDLVERLGELDDTSDRDRLFGRVVTT